MKTLHKCLNLLSRVLKVIVLAMLVAGAITLTGLHARGYRLLSVQTASMAPVIRPGDALIVAPADVRQLRPGQIISYHSPRNSRVIISHRLINFKNGDLITRGDALGDPDPPVQPRLLAGRATAMLPKFGHVLEVLRRPIGLIVFIFLPAITLLALELKRLVGIWSQPDYSLYGYRQTEYN